MPEPHPLADACRGLIRFNGALGSSISRIGVIVTDRLAASHTIKRPLDRSPSRRGKRLRHRWFNGSENTTIGVEVHDGSDRQCGLIGPVSDGQIEATGHAERSEEVSEYLLEAEIARPISRGHVDVISNNDPPTSVEASGDEHLRQMLVNRHHRLGHVLEKTDPLGEVDLQGRANHVG
jgi:hypothetical protein